LGADRRGDRREACGQALFRCAVAAGWASKYVSRDDAEQCARIDERANVLELRWKSLPLAWRYCVTLAYWRGLARGKARGFSGAWGGFIALSTPPPSPPRFHWRSP